MRGDRNRKTGVAGRSTISAEAADFAPGLLSIQETVPARLPRAVLYSVITLFGLLLLWATFGQLDIVASATGRLVPKTYIKIVQPADAGIVEEILVREGEQVAAGQVLLRMDPQDAVADARTLRVQSQLKSLQLLRIDAELAGRPLERRTDDPEDLFVQVLAQYRDRRAAHLDALGLAEQQLRKSEQDYRSGLAVLSKLEQTNPILKSQADAYVDLGKDGYAPQVMVGDKKRAYLENTQDLMAQRATVAGLLAAVAQATRQVHETTSKYRSDLQNERVEAEGAYQKLTQDTAKQAHRSELLELRAPVAGVVKDLATHTVGSIVSAGTLILTVVPEHEPLRAEVIIRNDDIGFVHSRQKVKVKLAAYPFQRYGMLDGEVLQVWPDATDDSNSTTKSNAQSAAQSTEPAASGFKALIELDRQTLDGREGSFALSAGMQVIAEVREGRRTVLEYLLSPIQKTIHESGHER